MQTVKWNYSRVKSFSFLFLVLFNITAFSQDYSISGRIIDSLRMPLQGATLILKMTSDSTFITGAVSDSSGYFRINGLKQGNYFLRISEIGFRERYFYPSVFTQNVNLGDITLWDKASNLKEVEIVANTPPTRLNGDTTEHNADAYKTSKDANAEDLVTKMPGITVQDGKVQAQGEDVKQVLVDGRPYFGDDPNAVLKNLPAEVIDKIQVFDKKSDQSQFSGYDDGNTSKTINIVTKPQFRNGVFGKATAGLGYSGSGDPGKWKGGLALNSFKDKQRMTLLINSNNINEQNFSTEDLLGVMSTSGGGGQGRGGPGGGRGGPRGGGSGGERGGNGGPGNDASNFLVNSKTGITTTNSVGLNYSNKWKKLEFTGSYFFNATSTNAINEINRYYLSPQFLGLKYLENDTGDNQNMNHRVNLKFEWKLDSFNSFIIQPKFSLQQNNSNTSLNASTYQDALLLNSTLNNYHSTNTGFNLSMPVLYRHAFMKKGRTFSINLNPSMNQNKGSSGNESFTNYYTDTASYEKLGQNSTSNGQGASINSNLVYTEPITSKSQLMLSYNYSLSQSESVKNTDSYIPETSGNEFRHFDTSLSNNFNTHYSANNLGAGIRYQKSEKWNLMAGVNYQYAKLHSERIFPTAYTIDKPFQSILPNAMFQYHFANKKDLRIFYRSNNNPPSVSQLQDVININNPLLMTTGNPELKQDWQNNLSFRYSAVNTKKNTAFFSLLSGSVIRNYIATGVYIASKDSVLAQDIVLSKGSQISKPVNTNGYFSLRTFNNYSFPLKKIKSNLSLNLGASYSRTPGLVNGLSNYANTTNVGFGVTLSSNISEKVDFLLSSNSSYSNITNTLQQGLNSVYLNQNSRFKIQVNPWKGLVIQTELNHQYYTGLSQNYNLNYLLWNAGIGYKFLKNKQGELRLIVFDILNQNNNVTRNTTETYYEDVKTNALQRYVMLNFTYTIKSFKQQKPQAKQDTPKKKKSEK